MSTPIVPAPAFAKAITYNRETRDFDLLLDGQFVGTARSFYEGEEKLDALVYDQLQALRIDLADEAAAADEAAEVEAVEADEAARNFSDEADEAYQQAYRSGAQAMDAALDLTCHCDLCGGAVLPEAAALVGEQMACPDCAPSTANVGEAVDGAWRIIATEPATPRLLWSWAGNATALGAVVSERRAAWMAQQQRWLLAADAAGLLAAEHYEAK